MAFKIAYCAGHHLGNPKGVPVSMGLGDIREWTLNNRVAEFFAQAAAGYAGVQLLRTDDATGKYLVDIPERCTKANVWGADLYLDIHHNAGVDGGTGGGIVAFAHPDSEKGQAYRDAIYKACIQAGGLKGNRSDPLQEKKFDSLRLSYMPAVLMEYGFMDSATDAPVIVTESYAKLVAEATMAGIAKVAGLAQKEIPNTGDDSYLLEDFVKDVQRACGAAVDGIAGPETLSKTVTISATKNDTPPAVLPVQKRLQALGYTQVGDADGIAGPKFEAAVLAFQRDKGCWTDGEITARNKTWRKLLGME